MPLPSQYVITTPGELKNLAIGGDVLDAGDVFTDVVASVAGAITGGTVAVASARPSSAPIMVGGTVNPTTGEIENAVEYATGRAILFDLSCSSGVTAPLDGNGGKIYLVFDCTTLGGESFPLRRELIISQFYTIP